MKAFISWSGSTSRKMADALKDWLSFVMPAVETFVSDQDIEAGQRWSDVLAGKLEETSVGIICVTPFNLKSRWLHFEAGALSKLADQSRIMPLLLGVEPHSMADGPLSQFQAKRFEEREMLAFVASLNLRLPPRRRLSGENLHRTFAICWPTLNDTLQEALGHAGDETETGFPWLFSAMDMERREIDPTAKSVWIITPWPYQDVQLACLVGMLRRNIALGVKYRFVIPCDSTGQSSRVLHDMFDGKVVVYEVETEKFESLAVTHYVVLNPLYEDACSPRVFLEIPTKDRGYWVETSPDAAIKFANRFSLMIPPHQCLIKPLTTGDAPSSEAVPS